MQLEVGQIYEGKVTGITKFGAFVDFAEGKTGMVHISEVASAFVKDINDFVSEGQTVKVMILGISDVGKISLSMKKAEPPKPQAPRIERPRNNNFRRPAPVKPQSPARPGDFEWQSSANKGTDFEDMMSKFKQTSDEKISDLKRNTETRRGGGFSKKDNHR